MPVVYSLALMGALPSFSLSFSGGYFHISTFSMQKLAGSDFNSQGQCCMHRLAENGKSNHRSWHFLSEVKSVTPTACQQLPEKQPCQPPICCPACTAAHRHSCLIPPLPLKNLHLSTRHNTSLNKGQASTQKSSWTTARTALSFCARLFFTSEAHEPAWPALSQTSPVHLGTLGLGDPSTCWALRTRSPHWRHITAGPQHVPAAFVQQLGRSGTGRPKATRGQPEQRASKRVCAWIKGSYGFPFAFTHFLLYVNIYGNNFSQYQSTKELNEFSMPTLPWDVGTEQVRGP